MIVFGESFRVAVNLDYRPNSFSRSKSTTETSEQCVKFVKVKNEIQQKDVNDVAMVFLSLTWNRFHKLSWCFDIWLWASKYRLGKGSNKSRKMETLSFEFWQIFGNDDDQMTPRLI